MGAGSNVMDMVIAKTGRFTDPIVPGGAPAAGTNRKASTEGSAISAPKPAAVATAR